MLKRLIFLLVLSMFAITSNSQPIPKWKIEDVVRSYSAKNDTVYVVNFWATFCKPCIEEIPHFIRIVDKYKDQKVKLLLVSLDLPSFYPAKIASFAKKNNYNTNIVWLNETNADHFCPMIDKKWSGAIPATIIVNNKTGYCKFTEDQMSAEELEASLKEAMGGHALLKYVSPMNDAEVIDYVGAPQPTAFVQRDYVTFKSKDSSVYSVIDGTVNTVVRIDDIKVVIIIDEHTNLFYTYSNLGSTVLKKGDVVKKGQLIGYAAFDLDGNGPAVELYVNDAEKSIVLTKENFTLRKDSRFYDHSTDPVSAPMKVQKNK